VLASDTARGAEVRKFDKEIRHRDQAYRSGLSSEVFPSVYLRWTLAFTSASLICDEHSEIRMTLAPFPLHFASLCRSSARYKLTSSTITPELISISLQQRHYRGHMLGAVPSLCFSCLSIPLPQNDGARALRYCRRSSALVRLPRTRFLDVGHVRAGQCDACG